MLMPSVQSKRLYPIIWNTVFIFWNHRLSLELLNLVNNSLESLRVVNSEVSEHLTVDLDTCLVKRTHQLTIAHVLQTSSSIDTLDPQCAEIALLVTTVTISVSKTLLPSVLSYCPYILASSIVTLSELKDFCSFCFLCNVIYWSWHNFFSLKVRLKS